MAIGLKFLRKSVILGSPYRTPPPGVRGGGPELRYLSKKVEFLRYLRTKFLKYLRTKKYI